MEIVSKIIYLIVYGLTFAWAVTLIGEKIKFKVGLKYGLIYVLSFFISYLSLFFLGLLGTILIFLISVFIGGIVVFLFGTKVFKDKFIKIGDVFTTVLLTNLLMWVFQKVIWVVSYVIYFLGQ